MSPPVSTLETRKRVVDLSREGHSVRSIMGIMGWSSPNAVQEHLVAYRATLTPSAELAEEWRETKLARADERFRVLRAKSLGEQDDHGNWIKEPDYQALSALQREEADIAKLLGANIEVGVSLNVTPSAEALAALLGWDPAAQVIDGSAEEIHEPEVPSHAADD
jgi:hypothetical protein